MSDFFYYFQGFFFQGKFWGFSSQQSGNTEHVAQSANVSRTATRMSRTLFIQTYIHI